jgi:hypothetical protein
MKRLIVAAVLSALLIPAFAQVKISLGVRGGPGYMMSYEKLRSITTVEGRRDIFTNTKAWSGNVKGEAMVQFWKLRMGYQFLYNFSPARNMQTVALTDAARSTIYLQHSRSHLMAHYFAFELALINKPHFALVPGIALGGYNGWRKDPETGDKVRLSEVAKRRFTMGAQLNAEISYGRFTFLIGPNYYLFSMRDKATKNWHEYQHMLGVDAGMRFNLLKGKKNAKNGKKS